MTPYHFMMTWLKASFVQYSHKTLSSKSHRLMGYLKNWMGLIRQSPDTIANRITVWCTLKTRVSQFCTLIRMGFRVAISPGALNSPVRKITLHNGTLHFQQWDIVFDLIIWRRSIFFFFCASVICRLSFSFIFFSFISWFALLFYV